MSIFNLVMACDFERPEIEILCDLIYHSTGYRLSPSRVVFQDPQVLDPRLDVEDDVNTYIPARVDPKFDSRLVPGKTGFLYTRLPIGAVIVDDMVPITPPEFPFTTLDILDQINDQLKLNLTADDIENKTYTSPDEDFVISTNAKSKIWIGERKILVSGGGNKQRLFPDDLLTTWLTPSAVSSNSRNQLATNANQVNGVSWSRLIDYTFGMVESGITNKVGRNSRVFVKAKREGYEDQWLYFMRADPKNINDQFTGSMVPTVITPRVAFTVHEILDLINDALNIHLTIDDVENTTFLPGETSYPIRFKTTSFAWQPGVYVMKSVTAPMALAFARMSNDGVYRLAGPNVFRQYTQ